MTEALFFAASPVFTVDGEDQGELARDLVRLECRESLDGLKTLQARFVAVGPRAGEREQGLLYQDGRLLDFGKAIKVAIGPLQGQRTIFEGVISALELSFEEGQEPEVCLFAEDRLMALRMTRRMRSYEAMSDADIAAAIAAAHGLSPEVDVDGPTYDRIQQFNMSDLAFLRERARLVQADVWTDGRRLFFQSRDRRQGPDLTLVRGNDIIAVSACADLAHQRTRVRVSGYDAARREAIDEEADEAAIGGEVTRGRSGVSILSGAFGDRVSYRVREVPLASGEAADWARAEMRRRARGFVQVNGVTSGHPDLVVGARVTLERLGPVFSGDGYYVTQVAHSYDLSSGHRTHFRAERATVGHSS
jgi:uncharacterized protein